MHRSRLLALLLAVATTGSASAAGLRADARSRPRLARRSDDVVATVTITNDSARPMLLPRWQVPGARLEADLFSVTRDGKPVDYLGILVKRPAPRPADFVAIAPGAVPHRPHRALPSLRHERVAASTWSPTESTSPTGNRLAELATETEDGGLRRRGDLARRAGARPGRLGSTERHRRSRGPLLHQLLVEPAEQRFDRGRQRHHLCHRLQELPQQQDLLDGRPALHHLVRRQEQRPIQHRQEPLHGDRERLPDQAGGGRLRLHRELLRLRLPDPALQDLRLQRLLVGTQHRHRLARRHAGARDVALQRRRRHRRLGLRPDRLQEPGDADPEEGRSTTPTATSTSPRTPRP